MQWHLRTYRGHWFEGLGNNWAQTELLVLARTRPQSLAPPPRVAATTIAVVCGGKAPSSRRALQLAARLASSQHQPLLVLALPDCPYRSTRELFGLLPGQGPLRLEALTTEDPSELTGWLPATTDTLVLPRDWIWPGGRPAPHPLLELPGIQALVVR
ncbi:hypothetical protein [Marinobacterium aestuariivivens]|uniref:Uncharacterized protein n=1 Tax=Marinobacterium aestuariivivens TaxID=1698799 RepID=A0ABW2A1Q0_9GAMM